MLAYVYTQDGISIYEALIREGLATAWTRDGRHRDYLVGLEREAERQESGCLWWVRMRSTDRSGMVDTHPSSGLHKL